MRTTRLFQTFLLISPTLSWTFARPGWTTSTTRGNVPFTEQLDLDDHFWNAFTFPNDVQEALSINSTLFVGNVIGQVNATRTLHGGQLNTEYIFGSFRRLATTSITSLLGFSIHHKLNHFASKGSIVAAAEVVWFDCSVINETIPVEIDAWFVFDKSGRVSRYDVTFRRLEWVLDHIVGRFIQRAGLGLNEGRKLLESHLIRQVCQTASTYCVGRLSQYDDIPQCVDFLSWKFGSGTAYEFGRNTLLCRILHQLGLSIYSCRNKLSKIVESGRTCYVESPDLVVSPHSLFIGTHIDG